MFTCVDCGKIFKTRVRFQNHTCNKCQLCKKIFSSRTYLEKHDCKKGTFTCKDCKSTYTTKHRLEIHKCKYCKICDQIFSTYQCFTKHLCKKKTEPKKIFEHGKGKVFHAPKEQRKNLSPFEAGKKVSALKLRKSNYIKRGTSQIISSEIKKTTLEVMMSNDQEILVPDIDKIQSKETAQYKPKISKHKKILIPEKMHFEKNMENQHKKLSTCENTTRKSQLPDVYLNNEEQIEIFHFNIINLTWQMSKCPLFELPVHSASMPLYDTSQKKDIGTPTNLKHIRADGNCYFRAISYVLTGSEDHHRIIRTKIVNHILTLGASMSSLLRDDTTTDTYISQSKMNQNGKWATEVEILATANLLKTSIYTYSTPLKRWIKFAANFIQQNIQACKEAIYLQNTNGDHYDVVTATSNFNIPLLSTSDHKHNKTEARKSYMTNYKRKQRSNESFRLHENKLNKQRRLDPKFISFETNYNKRRRLEPEFTQWEKDHNKARRLDPEFSKWEKDHNKARRLNPEFTQWEKDHNKARRLDPEFTQWEKDHNKARRLNPEFTQWEKDHNKARRLDPEFSQWEKDHNKARRLDPEFTQWEKDYNKARRSDPEFSQWEKDHNKARRLDPEFTQWEKDYNKARRLDPEFSQWEKDHNKARRLDPEFTQWEKDHNKARRLDPKFTQWEKDYNHNRRLNADFHQFEIDWKKLQRSDPLFREKEKLSDVKRKRSKSFYAEVTNLQQLIVSFQEDISKACNYVCTCCQQLWFKESVVTIERVKNVKEPLYSQCITGIKNDDGHEYLCFTCLNHINKGKLPPLSIQNKMNFPKKPPELQLNSLEEKLVAPVSTFFQMKELPSGKQHGILGNVVNVPADNLSTVSMLPRHLADSQTIPVKLKRRLRYKSHVMFENIRPQKCITATKYLLTKPLFIEYVTDGLDETWLETHLKGLKNTEWEYFIKDDAEDDNQNINKENFGSEQKNVNDENNNDCAEDDDNWSEYEDNEKEKNLECDGIYDTMLYPQNIDSQRNILSFAPSEGNIPVSSFTDNIEELSFPAIFCGEKRPSNKERSIPVKYSEICKSELRQRDRRAAQNITNIFFKAKKIQMKHIQDKVWLSLKRLKTKGQHITVKDMTDNCNIENIIKLDDGYKIFRTLRGSPPYWECTKKDLFAMVRQLGLPTFFLSMSAAETRWKPLLKSLSEIVDGKKISDTDVDNLTWQKKSRLIRSDPVTTARYFDYRVNKFFHSFLSSPVKPLGVIQEFFYRIEFQQRGSPHIHAVLWIENAPLLHENKNQEIEEFISSYITTDRQLPTESTENDIVRVQCHRHSHTCRKKAKKICRFNFPLPPMTKTRVLEPLPSNITDKELLQHKKNYQTVQQELDNKTTLNCTFEEFFQKINMTEDQYIQAIRSSLKETTIFLKRDPDCIRVNGYNDTILRAWMANMDLQYITNAYACLMYIVNYVSKGQRGMSNLLRRACDDARKENSDIRNQVRKIGNKFLKHVEISAQEAVYITLQMKLKNSSCGHIFINTSPPEERPFIVKPLEELLRLPENSTDIQCSNVIQRYSSRPKSIENITLADFAAWYDMKLQKKNRTQTPEEKELKESDDDDNMEDYFYSSDEHEDDTHPQTVRYKNGIILKLRKKKKIIRYVRYSKEKDPENYFREMLLLFFPWRKEENIKNPSQTYEERYKTVQEQITRIQNEYQHHVDEIEAAEEQIEKELEEEAYDQIAPNTQHKELKDENDQEEVDLEMKGENLYTEFDIGNDLNCAGTDTSEEILRDRLSDEDFRKLVQSLNKRQKEFFYHVLKTVKTTENQMMLFLSGGAGVGKTRLTKSIHQALIRYLNSSEGDNPEQMSVLLTAPTGKAAYLLRGWTIHTAFHIPANQGFQYKPLKYEFLNTLRHKMEHLRVIIIDEISMCGNRMFSFINQRMQEITGISKPFGGISVIAIGDLYQLKPVMDSWIFKQPKGNSTEILSENIWQDHFLFFELSEIMRQKDDQSFAELLNRVREGNHTKEDIDFLKTRSIDSTNPSYPTAATHLLYYNRSVDMYNSTLFLQSTADKTTSKAIDTVIGDVSQDVKEQIKQRAKDTEMGLSKTCNIAVGMRIELTVNLDLNDGLVNGAGGIVKHIEYINKTADLVWVYFEDNDIGKNLRAQYRNKLSKQKPHWTPVKKISREFPVGKYKSCKIARKQFPLRLAAAKTIHRAQGDTLQQVVVEFPQKKECHMHYVAISRAQKAKDLYIIGGINGDKVTVSQEVKLEMERLRKQKLLQLCFTPIYSLQGVKLKVCFHNVQSLTLHKEDVKYDFNFLAADIIFFVETKLCNTDKDEEYNFPGFDLFRNDFSSTRTAYGSIAYIRNSLQVPALCKNYQNIELTFLNVGFVQCIAVYSRPKETISSLITAMKQLHSILDQKIPIVIMGDFNCNIRSQDNRSVRLLKFMKSLGLRQLINDHTTDGQTIIDLIFTNMPENMIRYGTLESYFSYHKPLWISIK